MGKALGSAFVTVLILLEPFSLAPTFLSLTERQDPKTRARSAYLAVSVAALVLLAFAVVGEWIIHFLNITLEAVQVAGGVLLILVAAQMVAGSIGAEVDTEDNVAVVPLGTPLLAGPGTIVALLVLLDEHRSTVERLGIALGATLALLVMLVVLRFAVELGRRIRPSMARAVSRIMGLLVMAIGVQFIVTAIAEWQRHGVHPGGP